MTDREPTTIEQFIALANEFKADYNRHTRPFHVGAEAARQDGGYMPEDTDDVRASIRRAFPDEPADIIEAAIPSYEEAQKRVAQRSQRPEDWRAWGIRAARQLCLLEPEEMDSRHHLLREELSLYPDAEQEMVLGVAREACEIERARLWPLMLATERPSRPGRLRRFLAKLIGRPGHFHATMDASVNNRAAQEQAQKLGRSAGRFYKLHPDYDHRRWMDVSGTLHVEVVDLGGEED